MDKTLKRSIGGHIGNGLWDTLFPIFWQISTLLESKVNAVLYWETEVKSREIVSKERIRRIGLSFWKNFKNAMCKVVPKVRLKLKRAPLDGPSKLFVRPSWAWTCENQTSPRSIFHLPTASLAVCSCEHFEQNRNTEDTIKHFQRPLHFISIFHPFFAAFRKVVK